MEKLALVTGAASGIGRSFAQVLGARGYRLLLLDINDGALAETAHSVPAPPEHTRTIVADVSSAEHVDEALAPLRADVSSLDLLVNCAAILGAGPFAEQPLADFARVVQVDLLGTVHMIRATLPWLRAARGHVVNMASTASLHGWPLLAAYSAAKGAIENYSEAIRPELRREGVGLTTVFPLLVDTPLLQGPALPPILRGRRIRAEEVVEKTLQAVERRQARLYVPRVTRLVALAHGLAPPLLDWWGARSGLRRSRGA